MKLAVSVLRHTLAVVAIGGLALCFVATTGCDTKEEVLDIETPAGDVEVNRDKLTDDVEVDVSKDE
ncbi:hypothetical protein [Aeoliella sp.]|uniref:hypothetical protein n=1 Tax=Aeoliella sp. TaxID=2795800 RepID=UPI003CCBF5FD